MSLPDHSRSATALARGQTCWITLVASTNSPQMHACGERPHSYAVSDMRTNKQPLPT